MYRWLRHVIDKIGSPKLDWIQIEVTSQCNAACMYCPNPLLTGKRHLPLKLFEGLLPYLIFTDLIYLQGWGEPLLNGDLFEMIRACKAKNKQVGFTTNGMLLTEENAHRLVDLGLDILTVSLAGACPATNDQIRSGNNLAEIIANLDRLQEIKAKKGTSRPFLHFAYLMMDRNIHEMPDMMHLANRLAAEEVVASNLTLITRSTLQSEALFNQPDKQQVYFNILDEAAAKAADCNISFTYGSPILNHQSNHCTENVTRSCVVSVNGDISPCVFTSPTLSCADGSDNEKPLTCFFQGKPFSLSPLTFGNIGSENLTRIWSDKRYAEFRTYFNRGRNKAPGDAVTKHRSCRTCYKGLNQYQLPKSTPDDGSDIFLGLG